MGAILSEDYFSSNNTIKLAYDLIGKYIVRYSHARFGVTKKNYLKFDNPGYCYMYLCYAIHWLFNIVTGNSFTATAIGTATSATAGVEGVGAA